MYFISSGAGAGFEIHFWLCRLEALAAPALWEGGG